MRTDSAIETETIAGAARAVIGSVSDYDALLDLVGDRRFVLIGEASHGTHEFYRERARITRRLIDERGFTAVAVEGRLARRLPGEPLRHGPVARSRRRRRALRLPPVPGVDVAQPRRPAVRRVDARPERRARAPGDEGPVLRSRPLQPAGVDRSGHRLPRPRRSRRSAHGPAIGTRASTTSAPKGRRTATRSRTRARFPCENEVVAQLVALRAPCRGLPAPRRLGRRGRAVLRRAERASSCATPRSTTSRCTAPRSRRGTSATGTWPARSTRSSSISTASSATPRSSCGSTTRTSATRARRRWARAAS